jgi:hypothetical protein
MLLGVQLYRSLLRAARNLPNSRVRSVLPRMLTGPPPALTRPRSTVSTIEIGSALSFDMIQNQSRACKQSGESSARKRYVPFSGLFQTRVLYPEY